MRKLLFPIAILLITAACQTGGHRVDRLGEARTVLIALETAAENRLPDDVVGRRVLNEVSARSSVRGLQVFDGSSLTSGPGGSRLGSRPAADWIALARGHRRPPIDTVMLLSVAMESRRLPHARKMRMRVAGRMLDVTSGRWLGAFESARRQTVDIRCAGACLREAAGDLARVLAREVGDVLTDRLVGQPSVSTASQASQNSRGYTLVFDDFGIVEMRDIEEYLPIFSGYRTHRSVARYHRYTEVWYDSAISEARLRQNLEKMFAELGMKAHIVHDGSAYRIRQVRPRLRADRRAKAFKW